MGYRRISWPCRNCGNQTWNHDLGDKCRGYGGLTYTPNTEAAPSFSVIVNGKIPSSKNTNRPRAGMKGLMKDPAVKATLEAMKLEIQRQLCDTYLIHPDAEVFYYAPDGRCDRNNIWTTLLDMLVQTNVLWNDSIASYNGHEHHHPAEKGEWKTVVFLTGMKQKSREEIDRSVLASLARAARKKPNQRKG